MTPLLSLMILSVIQGFAEFMPISSSAHLILIDRVLGLQSASEEIIYWLHLGTTCSVLLFFRADLRVILRGLLRPKESGIFSFWFYFIVISSAVTFGLVLLIESFISLDALPFPGMILCLGLTGLVLLITRFFRGERDDLQVSDAVIFGVIQALSILPGLSRSGLVISCFLILGIRGITAFRYAYIASLPLLLGAFVLKGHASIFTSMNPLWLISSFLMTAAMGMLGLAFLKMILKHNKFHYFGFYCLLLSAVGFYMHYVS
jgi:undecaprenyl-diphosphatase